MKAFLFQKAARAPASDDPAVCRRYTRGLEARAAKTLSFQKDKTVAEIWELLVGSQGTIYSYLAHFGVPTGEASTISVR